MKVSIYDLDMSDTDTSRESNRALLRVQGQPVLATIKNDGDVPDYVRELVPEKYFISSVEVYPDGQMNFFLRRFASIDKRSDKIITIREVK